jgi:hypothetical protein
MSSKIAYFPFKTEQKRGAAAQATAPFFDPK